MGRKLKFKKNGAPDRRGRGVQRIRQLQMVKLERQVRVITLYREMVARGETSPQQKIAQQLNVTPNTVSQDLDELWPMWRNHCVNEVQAIVEAVCAEMDWIKAEARLAWTQSKKDQRIVTKEKGIVRESEIDKTTTTNKTQTGNPAYLSAIISAEDMRIKLTVGYKPTKTEAATVDLSKLDDEQLERLERGEPLVSVLRDSQRDATRPVT